MKRKSKPVASSRAASLKGWRTRRKMKERRLSEIGVTTYREWVDRPRTVLDDVLPSEPTINRVPKVEFAK